MLKLAPVRVLCTLPRQNCSAEDGLMRTRRDIPLSHTVSYGPIRRLLSDGEKPSLSMYFMIRTFRTAVTENKHQVWVNLCHLLCRCTRSPPSGDIRPRGPSGGLAADHRGVWEAVAPLQTFLPSPGGSAHSVQHPPHFRGGLVNRGLP